MGRPKKEEPKLFSQLISDRPLPNSKEVEDTILGSIIFDSSVFETVIKFIKTPETFQEEKNQIIYKAILTLKEKSEPIDLITLTDQLRKTNELEKVGGAWTVTELTNNVVNTSNIEYHCAILFQYHIRRTLTNYAMNLYDTCTDLTNDELNTFDLAVLELDKLKAHLISMKDVDFPKQVKETMMEIVDEQSGKIRPIRTGFSNVDELTGGRVNGESSIIAARTSMGKTTRMIKEILSVALTENKKVGVLSLETKSNTLIRKMLSNIARVDSSLFRSHHLTMEDIDRLDNAKDILKDYSIFIHDLGGINISEVKVIARKWKAQYDIDILYIDYMTLIKQQNPYTKNQNDEITKISQGIKELAMDLNIPTVTLAQINRSPEGRGDKRPQLSDLRDSGSIEQDADIVSMLYRPEYYGELQDANGNDLKGIMEESIKKNRNGLTGTVYHRFIAAIGEFEPVNFAPQTQVKQNGKYEPDKFTEAKTREDLPC